MGPGVKKKFQTTLILVFVVIVQPPKHTFEIGGFFHVLPITRSTEVFLNGFLGLCRHRH